MKTLFSFSPMSLKAKVRGKTLTKERLHFGRFERRKTSDLAMSVKLKRNSKEIAKVGTIYSIDIFNS